VVGFDIRCTPGQQQAVTGIQQGRQINLGPQSGDEHRQRVRTDGDGFDVLLAGHVEEVLSTQSAIGWNSDEGQARHV
jgi:hypothetical protein